MILSRDGAETTCLTLPPRENAAKKVSLPGIGETAVGAQVISGYKF
jgi:hypothetical protein